MNDLLTPIQPALDQMIAAGLTTGWVVAQSRRDTVEFERADKRVSIFWDASAMLPWMASDEDDRQAHGRTLADCLVTAKRLGLDVVPA